MKKVVGVLLSLSIAFPVRTFAADKDMLPFFDAANSALNQLVNFIEVENKLTKVRDIAPDVAEAAADSLGDYVAPTGPSTYSQTMNEIGKKVWNSFLEEVPQGETPQVSEEERFKRTVLAIATDLKKGKEDAREVFTQPVYKAFLYELHSGGVRNNIVGLPETFNQLEEVQMQTDRSNRIAIQRTLGTAGAVAAGAWQVRKAGWQAQLAKQASLNEARAIREARINEARSEVLKYTETATSAIERSRKNRALNSLRRAQLNLRVVEELNPPIETVENTMPKFLPLRNVRIPILKNKQIPIPGLGRVGYEIDRRMAAWRMNQMFIDLGEGSYLRGIWRFGKWVGPAALIGIIAGKYVTPAIRDGIDAHKFWDKLPSLPGIQHPLEDRDIMLAQYNPWNKNGNLSLEFKNWLKQSMDEAKSKQPNRYELCQASSRTLRDFMPAFKEDDKGHKDGEPPVHIQEYYKTLSPAQKQKIAEVVTTFAQKTGSTGNFFRDLKEVIKPYDKLCTIEFKVADTIWESVRNQYAAEGRLLTKMKFTFEDTANFGKEAWQIAAKAEGLREDMGTTDKKKGHWYEYFTNFFIN